MCCGEILGKLTGFGPGWVLEILNLQIITFEGFESLFIIVFDFDISR